MARACPTGLVCRLVRPAEPGHQAPDPWEPVPTECPTTRARPARTVPSTDRPARAGRRPAAGDWMASGWRESPDQADRAAAPADARRAPDLTRAALGRTDQATAVERAVPCGCRVASGRTGQGRCVPPRPHPSCRPEWRLARPPESPPRPPSPRPDAPACRCPVRARGPDVPRHRGSASVGAPRRPAVPSRRPEARSVTESPSPSRARRSRRRPSRACGRPVRRHRSANRGTDLISYQRKSWTTTVVRGRRKIGRSGPGASSLSWSRA